MDKLLEDINKKYLQGATPSANTQRENRQMNTSGGTLLDDINKKYGVQSNNFIKGESKSVVVVPEKEKTTFANRLGNVATGSAKSYGSGFTSAAGTVFDLVSTGTKQNSGYEQARRIEVYQRAIDDWTEELAKADTDKEKARIEEKIRDAQDSQNKLRSNWSAGGELNAAAAEKLYDATEKLSASAEEDIAQAKDGLGFGGQLAVDLGVAGTQLAGDALVAAMTGGSSLLPMAIRSFGSSAQEARQDGATLGKQVVYGAASAALSAGIEKLSNFAKPLSKMFGKGVADDFITKLSGKLGETVAGRTALSAIGEGSEEFLEGILSPVLQRIYDEDAKITVDTLAEAGYNALIGAGLGGVLGAAGEVKLPNRTTQDSSRVEAANADNATADTTQNESGTEAIVAPATEQRRDALAKQTAAPVEQNMGQTITQPRVNVEADANNTVGAAQQGFDPFTALQNQYGTLPEGENAVRPDDVPVSTNGTDRVSQSVVTGKGAKVTPDEFVPLLENETIKGGFSFIPITNDATVQAVTEDITENGWDSALRDWTADVRKGVANEKVTAMGAMLYNHAVNSGDFRLALDIFTDYQSIVRSSARGLQAARILKTLTPQSRLYMIERSIQRMVDDLRLDNPIEIPDGMVDAYLDAADESARDAAIDEIQQYVADNIPATKMDKWKALRYTNMLGNFKTQVRNVAGNVAMAAITDAKNAVAAGIEMITGGKVDRAHSVGFGKELVDAARADFAENRDYIVDEYKYDDNASADAFARGVMDKRTIFKWKPLEGYRILTNYAMNNAKFGDEAFARRTYSRALASYLHANGVTAEMFNDPSWRAENQKFLDKARASTKKTSQEATFRDHNTLSDWVSKIGRRADTPALGKAVAEGVLPFRRTPANILVRAAEYSPLGIVKNAVDIAKAKSGGDVSGSDIIDGIAKTLTGSGIFVLGMLLRNAGLLRGSADDDEKQQAFDELAGHQDYALELPDGTSITIDWLTPASMPLFMGAELMDLIHDGGFELKDLEQAMLSIAEPMLEMSMLQGINDTLGNLQYTEGNNLGQLVGSAALSYLTQGLSNSLVGQITRSTKDESTMTYVDKESAIPAWMQKSLGTMARKTPGWDYNQIPYIDAWGRTEEQGDFMTRLANNLFNPAYVSKVEDDAVNAELQRIYDSLGSDAGGIFPTRADKNFSVNGQTYNLSADEYVAYATAKGQYSRKYVEDAINSNAYKSMSDNEKAKLIGNLYKYANYKAKRESVPDYDNTDFHKAAEAEKSGITPAQFYSIKEKADANNNGVTKGELNIFFANDNTLSAQKEDKLKAILFPQK